MEQLAALHSNLIDPDRFLIAASALLLSGVIGMITGPLRGNTNPFAWIFLNGFFSGAGARLDRPERSPRALLTRGLIFSVIVIGVSALLGQTATKLVTAKPYHGITEILLLSMAVTAGTVWYAILKLYFALKEKKLGKSAYYIIARSTRRDLSGSDDFGITRTGMEYTARSFDKGIVAPVFWYLLAGLPGAYIYAGIAWLAWRFGKDGFSKGFGKLPLALEQLMGFVPSAFAGIIIAMAGLFTPTGGMTRALMSLTDTDKRAPYAQGGLPLTAMAFALNISMGGPCVDLDGNTLKKAWSGPKDASARLESHHLRRAIYILLMSYLIFITALFSSVLWVRI